MKCKHIILTFIFAIIAVLAISFIAMDTAKAETLYRQEEDVKLTLLPNKLTNVTGVDNGQHTSGEIILTGVNMTVKTNTTEARQIRTRSGDRLVISPQGNNVYLLLLQSGTTTVAQIARADYSTTPNPTFGAYALEIKCETYADTVLVINALNQNQLFRNLYVHAEADLYQYYARTQYDTRYIPQYAEVEWGTYYTTGSIIDLEEAYNVYNRQTGTLTFTVPANTDNDTLVIIGAEGLLIWDIADFTLQANVRHYNDTGTITIGYKDTIDGEVQYLETDFYTQPQLKTYVNMERLAGNKYFASILFAVPPSTEAQTITFSLGQGMFMKGYLSSQRDIETEKQIAYNQGYSAGIQTAEEGDWVHLMTALWDVPMAYINGIFDVTILGINLKELFKAVVLIALTAAIIKRFI